MPNIPDSAEALIDLNVQVETGQVDRVLMSESEDEYGGFYRQHIRDQYQLYVEMADRISNRRMLANSFFVGMNTAVVGAIAVSLKEHLINPPTLILAPVSAAILMCMAWWMMVRSYRRLNAGKFRVILAMEKRLPLAPFAAEWAALNEGQAGKGRYVPITSVELLVPWLFACIHAALCVAFLARGGF